MAEKTNAEAAEGNRGREDRLIRFSLQHEEASYARPDSRGGCPHTAI